MRAADVLFYAAVTVNCFYLLASFTAVEWTRPSLLFAYRLDFGPPLLLLLLLMLFHHVLRCSSSLFLAATTALYNMYLCSVCISLSVSLSVCVDLRCLWRGLTWWLNAVMSMWARVEKADIKRDDFFAELCRSIMLYALFERSFYFDSTPVRLLGTMTIKGSLHGASG